MKTKTILWIMVTLFLLIVKTGCDKDEKIPLELIGTWKLDGFGNTADNSFNRIDLTGYCESCFRVIISEKAAFSTYSQRPYFSENFVVRRNKILFDMDGEIIWSLIYIVDDNERHFVNSIQAISRGAVFEVNSTTLKLFYSDTEFLQFYRINN